MNLTNLMNGAGRLTDTANDAAGKVLDEFNAAMPTIRGLGFSVHDIQVSMGILPEIHAKLVADAADIDVKTLDDLIKKAGDQKTLVTVLKGLQAAYNVRDQLGDLGLSAIAIDLKLGIPPSVGIGFFKPVSALTPAAMAAVA